MVSCGDCIACCIFLKKNTDPPGRLELESCPYVAIERFSFSGKNACENCQIYEDRPDVCREFKCDYLLGKEDERPDKARNAWLENMTIPIPKFLGAKE